MNVFDFERAIVDRLYALNLMYVVNPTSKVGNAIVKSVGQPVPVRIATSEQDRPASSDPWVAVEFTSNRFTDTNVAGEWSVFMSVQFRISAKEEYGAAEACHAVAARIAASFAQGLGISNIEPLRVGGEDPSGDLRIQFQRTPIIGPSVKMGDGRVEVLVRQTCFGAAQG